MALISRYLIDTSVLARMSQPAVADPVVPLIDAGLVGTCAVLDLEALYGAAASPTTKQSGETAAGLMSTCPPRTSSGSALLTSSAHSLQAANSGRWESVIC